MAVGLDGGVMAELSLTDKVKATRTHFSDQWHAFQAAQFREMARDPVFDRRSQRKYAENARRHERLGGR